MNTPRLRWLPGMVAIGSLYALLGLAALPALARQPHTRQAVLQILFSAALAAGGMGLLALRRWGWALCAAGAVVLVSLQAFGFYVTRQPATLILALIHLVIFLYLVRPDVRSRLKHESPGKPGLQ